MILCGWLEAAAASGSPEVPAVHLGFLARAKSVPVEGLQQLAAASGRRLVLCRHSLVSVLKAGQMRFGARVGREKGGGHAAPGRCAWWCVLWLT